MYQYEFLAPLKEFVDIEDMRNYLPYNLKGHRFKRRSLSLLEGMVWHQAQSWSTIEEIARYHTGPNSQFGERGLESISYSLAIQRDGTIVICNDLDLRTWSHGDKTRPGDENTAFVAVLFLGHFGELRKSQISGPTGSQITSGLLVWKAFQRQFLWSNSALYGHSDFNKPNCPGTVLSGVIKSVQRSVGSRQGGLKNVQEDLQKAGFYSGKIDGVWGERSISALRNFSLEKLKKLRGTDGSAALRDCDIIGDFVDRM